MEKFFFYKNLGHGLTIAILALASLSAMVYHDDAIAAGGGNGNAGHLRSGW